MRCVEPVSFQDSRSSLIAAAASAADPGGAAGCGLSRRFRAGRVFPMSIGGNPAGYHRECRLSDGAGLYLFAFNDRGRGPSVRSRIEQDAAGIPTVITVEGNDYLKNAIAERFSIEGGRAAWQNKVEAGERKLEGPAFYLSQSGTPAELPMLAKAALASPAGTIALLPSGEARAEVLDKRTVKNGDRSTTVRLVALYGLGYQPVGIWLDGKGEFFASVDSWVTLVPEGWEPVAPELLAAQEEKLNALRRAQATRLRQMPKGPLLVEHANLFDAEAGAMKRGSSVLVEGNTIRAVGADGSFEVPPGTQRIDAAVARWSLACGTCTATRNRPTACCCSPRASRVCATWRLNLRSASA